jgi:putative tricarboxylic transport membrane protein
MTRADVVAGALLTAGFCATLWEASSFQYGTQFAPGPGFAPVWLSAIGIALSLLVVGNALRAARRSEPRADGGAARLDRIGLFRVGATLIGLVVMLGIVPYLGLVPSLLAFLLFLTMVVQRLSWPLGIGASVATVLFIYLVFVRFLGVPIPSGPLGV